MGRTISVGFIVGVFGAAVAACNTATDSVDGATVFQSTCAGCHGTSGKPPAAMVARLNVRDLSDPEFGRRVTVELVEKQVRHGSTSQLMPAFGGALTEDQIKAVAKWVTETFRAPR